MACFGFYLLGFYYTQMAYIHFINNYLICIKNILTVSYNRFND